MGATAELNADFLPLRGLHILEEVLDRHAHADNANRIRIRLTKDSPDAENFGCHFEGHVLCIDLRSRAHV